MPYFTNSSLILYCLLDFVRTQWTIYWGPYDLIGSDQHMLIFCPFLLTIPMWADPFCVANARIKLLISPWSPRPMWLWLTKVTTFCFCFLRMKTPTLKKWHFALYLIHKDLWWYWWFKFFSRNIFSVQSHYQIFLTNYIYGARYDGNCHHLS